MATRYDATALDTVLSVLPQLPRPVMIRIVTRAIDMLDDAEPDPDLEEDDPPDANVEDDGEVEDALCDRFTHPMDQRIVLDEFDNVQWIEQ